MVRLAADYRSRRKRQRDAATARGRRWGRLAWREGGVLRERMRTRSLDADELRARALEDARGQFEGAHLFPATASTPAERWDCYRSVSGRTDQLDVFVDGQLAGRVGRKLLGLCLAARYSGVPFVAALARYRPAAA